MAFRITRKKNVNIMRVGVKIITTVLGLWVAGYMLQIVGGIMNGTYSPFYKGVQLIGWTVSDSAYTQSSGTCYTNATAGAGTSATGCITATSGSGVLAVVGLLAIVWVVFEFVDVSY